MTTAGAGGPSPAVVAAAMMHTYVLNGLSPVASYDVVVDVHWKCSPVSCTVTLMTYIAIFPETGFQEMLIDVDVTSLAVKPVGCSSGTKIKN